MVAVEWSAVVFVCPLFAVAPMSANDKRQVKGEERQREKEERQREREERQREMENKGGGERQNGTERKAAAEKVNGGLLCCAIIEGELHILCGSEFRSPARLNKDQLTRASHREGRYDENDEERQAEGGEEGGEEEERQSGSGGKGSKQRREERGRKTKRAGMKGKAKAEKKQKKAETKADQKKERVLQLVVPGGRHKENEKLLDTVVREFWEETGRIVDRLALLQCLFDRGEAFEFSQSRYRLIVAFDAVDVSLPRVFAQQILRRNQKYPDECLKQLYWLRWSVVRNAVRTKDLLELQNDLFPQRCYLPFSGFAAVLLRFDGPVCRYLDSLEAKYRADRFLNQMSFEESCCTAEEQREPKRRRIDVFV